MRKCHHHSHLQSSHIFHEYHSYQGNYFLVARTFTRPMNMMYRPSTTICYRLEIESCCKYYKCVVNHSQVTFQSLQFFCRFASSSFSGRGRREKRKNCLHTISAVCRCTLQLQCTLTLHFLHLSTQHSNHAPFPFP